MARSDRLSSSFVPSVSRVRPLVMTVNYGKSADLIEVPLGLLCWVGPRNAVFDGAPDPFTIMGKFRWNGAM